MSKIKKHIKLLIPLAVLLVASVVGVLAYLTATDTADNAIRIGSNDVEIVEDFDPPDELLPNTSFHKDVKIKNMGESPCYIRVKVKFTDMDIGKYCTLDINKKWVLKDDGYYYYPDLVDSEEITESLFTTVEIGDAPEEAIKDFDIIVYAESVQIIGDSQAGYEETWELYQKNKDN